MATSQKLPITCGVPQGSILGPLLFLIYINDMHMAVEFSTIHHFADDTNILYSCKSLKGLRKRVNADLAYLHDWLCKIGYRSMRVLHTCMIGYVQIGYRSMRVLHTCMIGYANRLSLNADLAYLHDWLCCKSVIAQCGSCILA